MQWLQNPNQSNVDDWNTVRFEASRHFRNEKKECLEAKIDDLKLTARPRISETCIGHQGYQPRTNIVKDEKGDLVTDSHSILGR